MLTARLTSDSTTPATAQPGTRGRGAAWRARPGSAGPVHGSSGDSSGSGAGAAAGTAAAGELSGACQVTVTCAGPSEIRHGPRGAGTRESGTESGGAQGAAGGGTIGGTTVAGAMIDAGGTTDAGGTDAGGTGAGATGTGGIGTGGIGVEPGPGSARAADTRGGRCTADHGGRRSGPVTATVAEATRTAGVA